MSSCDEALAEYHILKHKYETNSDLISFVGITTGVATAAMLLAIVVAVVAAALLASGPQAAILPFVLLALLGVAALASIAALVGYLTLALWAMYMFRLSEQMDQAYAAVWNKCQNEPDRIPT